MAKFRLPFWFATAALLLTGRVAGSGEPAKEAKASALARIDLSFKLDPRLTRGLYLGDKWVSPPTFSIHQPAGGATVEAHAQGRDATGPPVAAKPRWVPEDPAMVAVTPDDGNDVRIAVLRPGESRLRVSADGVSRDLTIRAVLEDEALRIDVSQAPPAGSPDAEARARLLASAAEGGGYALGVDVGRRLRPRSAGLDPDLVARGLRDALAGGNTLLTEDELEAALVALPSGPLASPPAPGRREVGARNRAEGEAFLAENAARDGVVTLESGLQYRVLKAGAGRVPTADDTVVCHYRGTLLDGREFDSSYERQKPARFPLRRVIPGWREALQRMPTGSRWQLIVPPELAYGERGARRTIGPHATLVFEVELVAIEDGRRSAGEPGAAAAGDEGKPPGPASR